MDDETLLARIAAGDPDAMAEFYLRWFPQFARIAAKLTGSADAGEDVAQDAIVRVLTCAGSYQPGRSVRSWLITIVRNRIHDLARRAEVRRAASLSGPDETETGGARAIEVPAREPTPDEQVLARERADIVNAALARLTDAEREVILLRDYVGLSAPETARELGLSVEKVGSRLFRARRRFGAVLQTDWPGLFPAHEL